MVKRVRVAMVAPHAVMSRGTHAHAVQRRSRRYRATSSASARQQDGRDALLAFRTGCHIQSVVHGPVHAMRNAMRSSGALNVPCPRRNTVRLPARHANSGHQDGAVRILRRRWIAVTGKPFERGRLRQSEGREVGAPTSAWVVMVFAGRVGRHHNVRPSPDHAQPGSTFRGLWWCVCGSGAPSGVCGVNRWWGR